MQTNQPRNDHTLLFAITIFISAFLLFQVQPLLAKFILPWFGGTPAVWTMCMLVFQVLLFGGYAYAHLLSSVGSVTKQACFHAGLLALAAFSLPIVPDASWKPAGDELPTIRIALLLLATVGMPYFLLSSTGPLLQKWFSYACPESSPYRLYALSNAGSLLALLSYPFVFEPVFSSTVQASLWSALFLVFALACLLCGWKTAMTVGNVASTESLESGAAQSIDSVTRIRWFMLAALPSVMLLATTNEVCMDIAVVPFLWIVPLTLYLLSFILTFESERFYKQRLFSMITAVSLALTSIMMSKGGSLGVIVQICTFFANLFLVCMLCHGELVRHKPTTRHLTSFYLTISAGGAAGGLFVGLAAPFVFSTYCELPWAIFCALLVCVGTFLRGDQTFQRMVPASTSLKFGFALSGILLLWFTFSPQYNSDAIEVSRNFYGVLRIEDGVEKHTGRISRDMVHGRVVHGRQFLDASGRSEPSTYYSKSSGVGNVFCATAGSDRKIGVVGLGAGTLAVYGQTGDSFRFYEINPDVIRLAWEQFSFLSDCPGAVEVIPGDARLVLEREDSQQFDVLVLDAFSGDAIPVHLLTTEAMEIYSRHLKQDGILAVHISNSYFDLEPVVRALGAEFKMGTRMQFCDAGADGGVALDSVWMLLSRDQEHLTKVLGPESGTHSSRLVYWTDDRNNLLNVLR